MVEILPVLRMPGQMEFSGYFHNYLMLGFVCQKFPRIINFSYFSSKNLLGCDCGRQLRGIVTRCHQKVIVAHFLFVTPARSREFIIHLYRHNSFQDKITISIPVFLAAESRKTIGKNKKNGRPVNYCV